ATALAPDRTTALSATLLACARDGAMARPAAVALDALTAAPDDADDRVAGAMDDLARVGHTSGRDLALGLLAVTGSLAAIAVSRTEDQVDAGVTDRPGVGTAPSGDDDGHHLLPSTTHDRRS
ncbi:DUF2877 domain-containing protein, partial [Salsipaludibacter albus]|uniref:oxamate carbamoyltransferase subunit AllH family protein n=1 Tax=Salsipaludibacter albus TaxID=2849650 RepID=UPI001EE3CE76